MDGRVDVTLIRQASREKGKALGNKWISKPNGKYQLADKSSGPGEPKQTTLDNDRLGGGP